MNTGDLTLKTNSVSGLRTQVNDGQVNPENLSFCEQTITDSTTFKTNPQPHNKSSLQPEFTATFPAFNTNNDKTDTNHNNLGNEAVTIIHFNDCYNIEASSQSSGAAGFLTAVNKHRHLDPMILFSGDILSPSFMSTFTKGEQMIPVLNDIGVHCAVYGNHEFDYGVDNLIEFAKRTKFPWLLSNVIDKETQDQLGNGLLFHIMKRQGIIFGIIGLIEEDWLSTLSTLDSSDVVYEDFVTRGQQLARCLKSEPHNVDYIIALTHFRTPNDIRLADSVPEIDLILGGHDHDYEIIKRPNCYIIKSGTDFREFSKITLEINPEYKELRQQWLTSDKTTTSPKPFKDLRVEHVKCIGYEPEPKLQAKLEKFVSTIDEKMGKVLGQFNCELDGRFSSIRKSETNLGNFITDIMLASTHADLAILNSGTLRSDRIHSRGNFTMRDLFNILGYIDPIAVLKATGHHIWRALENGVSQWPKLEGRFPQVSGCSFRFDPSKPPGQRIDPKDITVGDEQLDIEKHYRLTTKAYLASGKDGYDMLKECEVLVPGDESPDLTTSILNHFEAINIVKSNRRTHHRQSIICVSHISLQKILQSTPMASTRNEPLIPSSFDMDASPGVLIHKHSNSTTNIPGGVKDEQIKPFDSNSNATDNYHDGDGHDSDTFGDELITRTSTNQLMNQAASSPLMGTKAPTPSLTTMGLRDEATSTSTPPSAIERQPRAKRLKSLYEMEHEQCKLEPKIEGRIIIVGVNE